MPNPMKGNMVKKIIRNVPITRVWYEGNDLFIRCKARCGLYYLQVSSNELLDFLADSFHNDNKKGRVFKFVGLRRTKLK